MTQPDNTIVLLGGGGHALSLLEAMPAAVAVKGYTAPEPSLGMPVRWLGIDKDFRELYTPGEVRLLCAFVYGGRPDLELRRRIIGEYAGWHFYTLVAPTATVTRFSRLGEGTEVMHRAVVNRATLGRHCVVNTGAVVEHDCRIADNVFIGPGAVLGGEVSVGADSFIGLGAMVRNGVSIPPGTVVGMGAVITSDISEPGVYVGHGRRIG